MGESDGYVSALSARDVLENAQTKEGLPEPRAVIAKEHEYLRRRRGGGTPGENGQPVLACSGMALSGGGIRSAAFGLGVLQALSKAGLLEKFDYLSTVSGGGYLGGSLLWWLSGQGQPPKPFGLGPATFPYGIGGPHAAPEEGDTVEQQALLRFLRQRGEYITPGGGINLASGVMAVLRGAVVNVLLLLAMLTLGIVVLEFAGYYFIFATPYGKAVYGWIAPLLSDFLQRVTGSIVWLPPHFLLYLVPLLAAAGIALWFTGMLFWYSVSISTAVFGDNRLRYAGGRGLDTIAGPILTACAVLILISSLPFVDLAVRFAAAAAYEHFGALVSGLMGATGVAIGFVEFMRQKDWFGGKASDLLISIGCFLLLYYLGLLAYTTVRALFPSGVTLSAFGWHHAALGVAAVVYSLNTNLNVIGLHRYYRDRLMEAFMPDWKSVEALESRAAVNANTFRLHAVLEGAKTLPPFPLINTNVVLVNSRDLTRSERGGDSFVLSPYHCGASAVGWRQTGKFSNGGLTLASAMAVSGAAANPHGAGALRNSALSIVMTVLNLRLAYWVANPRPRVRVGWPNHFVPGLSQVVSLGRLGYHERAPFLQLSDGGHFENLGLYELIRRKVRLIVLCDGVADPQFKFEAFQRLARRAAIDFGAAVTFPGDGGLAGLLPTEPFGWPEELKGAKTGHLVGTLRYADGTEGTLIYVKATVTGGLPAEVLGYAAAHPSFPHQTTAHQWFDEEQFEAYRRLGHHLGTRMIAEAQLEQKLAAL